MAGTIKDQLVAVRAENEELKAKIAALEAGGQSTAEGESEAAAELEQLKKDYAAGMAVNDGLLKENEALKAQVEKLKKAQKGAAPEIDEAAIEGLMGAGMSRSDAISRVLRDMGASV